MLEWRYTLNLYLFINEELCIRSFLTSGVAAGHVGAFGLDFISTVHHVILYLD
jgi:hypothetical protein